MFCQFCYWFEVPGSDPQYTKWWCFKNPPPKSLFYIYKYFVTHVCFLTLSYMNLLWTFSLFIVIRCKSKLAKFCATTSWNSEVRLFTYQHSSQTCCQSDRNYEYKIRCWKNRALWHNAWNQIARFLWRCKIA